MALINCSECNKEISSKAANCPNCGCPLSEMVFQEDFNRVYEKSIIDLQEVIKQIKLDEQYKNLDDLKIHVLNKMESYIPNHETAKFIYNGNIVGSDKICCTRGSIFEVNTFTGRLDTDLIDKALSDVTFSFSILYEAIPTDVIQKRKEIQKLQENLALSNNIEFIPKCPTCGSNNIQKISLMDKALAAALVGAYAIGHASKTFYCNTCQYKW